MLATRRYPLEEGRAPRLEVKPLLFSHPRFVVRFDGTSLGEVELPANHAVETTLPNGQVLVLERRANFVRAELNVHVDGEPLPGSDDHPLLRVRNASIAVFFLSAAATVMAAVHATRPLLDEDARLNISAQFLLGSSFAVLGWLIRRGNAFALWSAMALFAAIVAAGIVMGGGAPKGNLLVQIIVLAAMARAVPAMSALKLRRAKIAKESEGANSGTPFGVPAAMRHDER